MKLFMRTYEKSLWHVVFSLLGQCIVHTFPSYNLITLHFNYHLFSSNYILHSFLLYYLWFCLCLKFTFFLQPNIFLSLHHPFTIALEREPNMNLKILYIKNQRIDFLCMSCSYSLCFKSDANYIRKNNINHMFFILLISPFFSSSKLCCSFLDYGTKGSWWYYQ